MTQTDSAHFRGKRPDVEVRLATAADVPRILVMLKQLTDAHEAYDGKRFVAPADPAATYGAWVAKATPGNDVLALVAEVAREGEVIGYLIAEHFEPMPKYWAPECIYVHDIFVEADARKTGAADALLERAAMWGQSRGVSQLRGIVAHGNQMGQGFFTRSGFRIGAIEFVRD
ncbi:MAG: GNAT family N-acetyltransferase [Planctomycetes bacterium]|nr:GNAT family N-acetyltransferase [Planctomycetota bacterium]